MSHTCSADLIVGVRLEKDAFHGEPYQAVAKVHKNCKDPGTGKFCSACGKELYETRADPIEGYDEEGGPDYTGALDGLEAIPHSRWITTSDYKNVEHKMRFLCGVRLKSWDDEGEKQKKAMGCMKLPSDFDIEKVKAQLKKVLEPRGLWKEEDFGIYVIWSQ